MLYFYSGTPGSGKSLHVARDIYSKLRYKKQNVIGNMHLDINKVRVKEWKVKVNRLTQKLFKKDLFKNIYRKCGRYYYVNNKNLTVDFLYKYADKFHQKSKENQTLLVIDEAQMLLSPTIVKLKKQIDPTYRTDWLEFFTQHRRLGYNVILISQFDRLIDAQVRCLFEYNDIHRKINNFKIGKILSLLKIGLFIHVEYWYGINQKIGSATFLYKKKWGEFFDSYEFQKSYLSKKKG